MQIKLRAKDICKLKMLSAANTQLQGMYRCTEQIIIELKCAASLVG